MAFTDDSKTHGPAGWRWWMFFSILMMILGGVLNIWIKGGLWFSLAWGGLFIILIGVGFINDGYKILAKDCKKYGFIEGFFSYLIDA